MVAGTYIFQLTVKDGNGVTASDSITITVNPAANIPPVANAGPSITIILPDNSVTLDGSKSSDADGTINAYSWTQISGPGNPASTGANTAILSLTGLIQGQYNYQLKVIDNSGAVAYAQVKITVVAPPNVSPIANAGPDQTITAPSSSVNLDGSSSYDPDGSISSYSWVLFSGAGSVTINNSNTANPSVIGLNPGQFVFQLTVTDNSGATSTDQVNITVNPEPTLPNQAPVANAGNNLTITAPVNSIGLNGTSSFDPDGTIVHYDWTQVSGSSSATITNNETTTPTASGLVVGTYTFQLMVTDNNDATNSDQITVTVNPAANKVNNVPVAVAGADTTIHLPVSTYLLNASGSYDPDGSITAYHWQEVSGPNTAVSSTMSGSETDISNLQAGLYEFQLTVTDNDGATATSMIKISVDAASLSGDQFLVYPNPASDVIHSRISSTVNGTVRVNVYDMSGKTVLKDELEKSSQVLENSIIVSGLATGMYTIQVNIGNRKTMVTKFIKN
jgi:ribosomal protein L14